MLGIVGRCAASVCCSSFNCQLWIAPGPALGQPSWEQPTPDACVFDPALNGEGFVVISPNDGFQTDRVAFDAQGRLYLNLYRVVDNHHFEDRIRRHLPNGQVDTTWGTNGIVDLPGEMFSGGSRTLAVDDLGRLWFARASYLNLLVVERFLTDGSLDTSLPVIEWHLPISDYDQVGDMTADGDGVVLACGISGGGAGSMIFRRIGSGSVVTSEDPQIVWPALEPVVLDVRADGWVAGEVSVGDGPSRGFVWSTSQRRATPMSGMRTGSSLGFEGWGQRRRPTARRLTTTPRERSFARSPSTRIGATSFRRPAPSPPNQRRWEAWRISMRRAGSSDWPDVRTNSFSTPADSIPISR